MGQHHELRMVPTFLKGKRNSSSDPVWQNSKYLYLALCRSLPARFINKLLLTVPSAGGIKRSPTGPTGWPIMAALSGTPK